MIITRKSTEKTNWDSIRDIVSLGNLNVGDEIADKLLTGEKITYVVAHITEEEVHFISKDCLNQKVPWNESGTKTGGFKNSDLCRFLNETVWNTLPEELRAVISERECLQIVDGKESRFSLKLWLPSEYEVFEDNWSSKLKEGHQFDIFKEPRNRIKGAGDGGRVDNWWLLSMRNDHYYVCYVDYCGNSQIFPFFASFFVPVCFSIKIKE